ncbi:DUF3313 family protein [Candidatus Colwellia aromaticivorans]|uniref:DUF3313 family protein n=1 Tax=Candidatus Colwellia aromaticivorans TaxID=2267621 RepID=UPI000DF32E9C|nr:DUF3313 family protein [Candidatus Colwellia aromaticivorans]
MKKSKVIKLSIIAVSLMLAVGCQSTTEAPQVSQDGMQLKVNKRSTIAYKKEGVNFSEYNKVLILPSQVAFKKNWQRDYNRSQSSSARIKDKDVLRIKEGVAKLFDDVFKEEFGKIGDNPLVEKVEAGTLVIKPAIINLDVNAPDVQSAGRVTTYVNEAGKATLFLELYDGVSGEILARIIDSEVVGDNMSAQWANRVSNTADAKRTFRKWAKALRVKYDQAQAK